MSKAIHTPPTWNFAGEGIFDKEGDQIASTLQNPQQYFKSRGENIANAEFIVLAVNNHDELTALIREFKDFLTMDLGGAKVNRMRAKLLEEMPEMRPIEQRILNVLDKVIGGSK